MKLSAVECMGERRSKLMCQRGCLVGFGQVCFPSEKVLSMMHHYANGRLKLGVGASWGRGAS